MDAKNEKIMEIVRLKLWFDNDYMRKEQKLNRLIALNKLDDSDIEPTKLLVALYEEAETKRKRIQELEKLLVA